jgi:hypothetical protein
VQLFSQSGISTVFTNLEGFPADWKENPDSFVKFVRLLATADVATALPGPTGEAIQ